MRFFVFPPEVLGVYEHCRCFTSNLWYRRAAYTRYFDKTIAEFLSDVTPTDAPANPDADAAARHHSKTDRLLGRIRVYRHVEAVVR